MSTQVNCQQCALGCTGLHVVRSSVPLSMTKLDRSFGSANDCLTCKKWESIACLGVEGVAENDQTAYKDDGKGNGAPEPPVLLQLLLEALEA